jgi:broad specificity phosphatase PhoE
MRFFILIFCFITQLATAQEYTPHQICEESYLDTQSIYQRAFFFLRHGVSDWNKDMLVLGPQNLNINYKGKSQVEQSAEVLQGHNITCIFTSPLQRCLDTAQMISVRLGNIPVTIVNELEERNFGDWSKIRDKAEALVANAPEGPAFFRYVKDEIEKILPEDAESVTEFENRTRFTLNKLLDSTQNISGYPLIISHGCFKEAFKKYMGNIQGTDKPKLFTQLIFFNFKDDERIWELINLD